METDVSDSLFPAVESSGSSSPAASQSEAIAGLYIWLRRISGAMLKREQPGHTLQATALANEVMFRLWRRHGESLESHTDSHLKGLAAKVARQVLVDHARRKLRLKRGSEYQRVAYREGEISEPSVAEVLTLEAAMTEFEDLFPEEARLVHLRFWGGMTSAEAANELGWSQRTAARRWVFAKAWLQKRVSKFREGGVEAFCNAIDNASRN
jgi:RNA polymerase sigma factor (TIGR02999 family)